MCDGWYCAVFVQDVAVCFVPKDGLYEASLRNKDTIGLLDYARAEYDRVIRDDFLQALADYLRQAGTLRRRKNERDRRKIDMERYKSDYQRQMEKADHTGAMQNKRKVSVVVVVGWGGGERRRDG